jgi:hypothetical protein
MRSIWPVGGRDILLTMIGGAKPDGTIYLASTSTDHPDYPEDPKLVRINNVIGSYYFEPINEGKGTRFLYITEVS